LAGPRQRVMRSRVVLMARLPLACIIGARRAWTVEMISSEEMPCSCWWHDRRRADARRRWMCLGSPSQDLGAQQERPPIGGLGACVACVQCIDERGAVCVDVVRDPDPVVALPEEGAVVVGLGRPALRRRVRLRVRHVRVSVCAQAIREPKQGCTRLRRRRGRWRGLYRQQVLARCLGGLERGGRWVNSGHVLEIEVVGEVRYPMRAHAVREVECVLLGLGLVRVGLAVGAERSGGVGAARGDRGGGGDRGCDSRQGWRGLPWRACDAGAVVHDAFLSSWVVARPARRWALGLRCFPIVSRPARASAPVGY
jgi:hypothetical protein